MAWYGKKDGSERYTDAMMLLLASVLLCLVVFLLMIVKSG